MKKKALLVVDVPESMEDGRLHNLIEWLIGIGKGYAEGILDGDEEDRNADDALSIKVKSIEVVRNERCGFN